MVTNKAYGYATSTTLKTPILISFMNQISKSLDKLHDFHEKNYKIMILIPIAIFLLSLGILVNNKMSTGEFITKDIDLKGGTVATLLWEEAWGQPDVEQLGDKLPGVTVREVKSYTGQQTVAPGPTDQKQKTGQPSSIARPVKPT